MSVIEDFKCGQKVCVCKEMTENATESDTLRLWPAAEMDPFSNECIAFLQECVCVQSKAQSHRNTHTPSAGLPHLNLQDNRSAETHTTSCPEEQRSPTGSERGFIVTLTGETEQFSSHCHANVFVSTLELELFIIKFKKVLISSFISSETSGELL